MRYLCLAYGDEEKWNTLSGIEQDALLAVDEELRKGGHIVEAVQPATTVRVSNGTVSATEGPYNEPNLPLAGFSLITARDLNEVIRLVSNTPCARAGGAIEVRAINEAIHQQ